MYNVLIVEDDPMVAMINEQYVCRNKNFKVVKSCRNGQEALEYLDNNTADSYSDVACVYARKAGAHPQRAV